MWGQFEYTPVSKPGAVGTSMPAALKGERDKDGMISDNYKGRPRNADPFHPHAPNPDRAKTVSDWTKGHMKERREEAKRAKENK
ncbi:unnamed protein product, partial [Mesorhabditis spiculigera]